MRLMVMRAEPEATSILAELGPIIQACPIQFLATQRTLLVLRPGSNPLVEAASNFDRLGEHLQVVGFAAFARIRIYHADLTHDNDIVDPTI